MKMSQEKCRAGEVLVEARSTLGLSVEAVLDALRANGSPFRRDRYLQIERSEVEPWVTEWLALCDVLLLDVDSFSMGYSEKLHLGRIAWAISEGRSRFKSSGSCRPR